MFELTHRATIQCDWEAEDGSDCTHTEYFIEEAEKRSLEEFNFLAREYFEQRGWKLFGGIRCPYCHRCEKNGEIPYQDN